MNNHSHADMTEATRLTQAGRLTEATALLQRILSGGTNLDASREASPGRDPAPARMTLLRDLVPERAGVPEPDSALPSGGSAEPFGKPGPAVWARGARQAGTADALKSLLDRFGESSPSLDLPSGFRGVDGPLPGRRPPPLPEGARFETSTYANAAGSRAYKLYIPSGYAEQAVPLVVMLHGCTQSPDDFAAGTRMNELAEEQTFLVAYPAQASSANARRCWNWFSAADQRREEGEPSLIAGITREIMSEYAVDPDRVYVAGLSAGGAAAAIMGETYPDLYAAIGVHSGLACGVAADLPSALAAMRQGGPNRTPRRSSRDLVPTIVFHGDRDTTVSPVNGEQVIAQAKAGADLQPSVSRGEATGGTAYTRFVEVDNSGLPILERWVLHETGHAWSGGSAAGSYTDPRGPDASREMLRFFLAHPRSAS